MQNVNVILNIIPDFFSIKRPHATSLGFLSSPHVYEDKNAYPSATDIPNIKIFRFEENIYYANVDVFKKLFIKRIEFRVDDQIKAMNDDIMKVEQEYKARLAKPNRIVAKFKNRFQKDNIPNKGENFGQDNDVIDDDQLLEEKNKKVSQ